MKFTEQGYILSGHAVEKSDYFDVTTSDIDTAIALGDVQLVPGGRRKYYLGIHAVANQVACGCEISHLLGLTVIVDETGSVIVTVYLDDRLIQQRFPVHHPF